MSLLDELRDVIMQEEGKTEAPERVSVSVRENHYRIRGMWEESRERRATMGESESEEVEWPVDYRTTVEFDSELGKELKRVFADARSKIETHNGFTVESLHFGELAYEEGPFYTSNDADFRFLAFVTGEEDGYPNGRLIDLVVDELQKLDSGMNEDDIQDVEFVFSDQHPCKIVGVSGNLLTDEPFKYYSDVESVEEYVDTLADTEEEREELESKERYQVFFRLDGPDSDPPNEIKVRSEAEMEEFIKSAATVEGEYKYEGGYIGYEDGSTSVSFLLRLPYDDQ